MLIYCHRFLMFPNPAKPDDVSTWFSLEPKRSPQEYPSWIEATDTFSAALQAKYIELVDVPADKAAEIAQLARELRPEAFPPLAAETRRPFGKTGFQVL